MILQRYRNNETNQEVDAVKLTKDNSDYLQKLTEGVLVEEIDPFDRTIVKVGLNFETPAGIKRASEGDYVIYSGGYFFKKEAGNFEFCWQIT